MNAFDILDEMNLQTQMVLYGRPATLFPMRDGSNGVNGKLIPDETRQPLVDVTVIRSEWAERMQIGGKGQGVPTPPGGFKSPAAGVRHYLTLLLRPLDWLPRKGDEILYGDRPDQRYRLTEPKPDGGAGLTFVLSKV